MIDIQKIIEIESSGDPNCVSKTDAIGLMQIMPTGAMADWNDAHPNEQYTRADLFNPKVNVKIGDWYINVRIPAMLMIWDIAVTVPNILVAYNWGPSNLKKWIMNGARMDRLPDEPKRYIEKYMKGGSDAAGNKD